MEGMNKKFIALVLKLQTINSKTIYGVNMSDSDIEKIRLIGKEIHVNNLLSECKDQSFAKQLLQKNNVPKIYWNFSPLVDRLTSKWIPVSERLPEHSMSTLLFKGGACGDPALYCWYNTKSKNWLNSYTNKVIRTHPTHCWLEFKYQDLEGGWYPLTNK